jgi:hypothetical protein
LKYVLCVHENSGFLLPDSGDATTATTTFSFIARARRMGIGFGMVGAAGADPPRLRVARAMSAEPGRRWHKRET